jgi:hypothetical protein
VPFTIDLDTERIEMNTLAGDDTIAVKPGLAGRLGVLADGGSGNDRIEARNASADSIEGGSGADSAVVDLADTTANVETIDRPARSRAHIARKVRVALHNGRLVVSVWVSCPAGAESPCTGVVRLSTAKAVRFSGIKVRLDLGSRKFRVDPGETVKVKVKLPAKAGSLARHGKLVLRAVAASKENGAVKENARNLTLRIPRG